MRGTEGGRNSGVRWEGWLLGAAAPAVLWAAWLAVRVADLEAGRDPQVLGKAAPASSSVAASGRPASRAGGSDPEAERFETLAAAFDRRLDALSERIAAARRVRGGAPDAGRDADEAMLARLDVAAAAGEAGSLGRMAAWLAPFAAEEALEELTRALNLAPEQRAPAERALRAYFHAWFARLSGSLAGGDPAGDAGADPAWRDLADRLERDLHAVLTAEQFETFRRDRDARRRRR